MKINLIEADIGEGDDGCILRAFNRGQLEKEVADTCRANPGDKDLSNLTDLETIKRYFAGVYELEDAPVDVEQLESYCVWVEQELEYSCPEGVNINLSLQPECQFIVYRASDGSANCWGVLLPEMGQLSSALESFVLALTAEGFPVHAPEFKKALLTTRDGLHTHCGNYLTPAEREKMEMKLSSSGIFLELDVSNEGVRWRPAGFGNEAVIDVVDDILDYGPMLWDTRDEGLVASYEALCRLEERKNQEDEQPV
jgi:hypothetical protein